MTLNSDELLFLKTQLEKTPVMNESDLSYIKSAHSNMYNTIHNNPYDGQVLFTEKCYFYTLKNIILNEFLCKKFEEPIENLYTIHRLIYGVGGKCKSHKDRFTTHKTVSILLSDNFVGGKMFVNNKIVDLNKCGDYVIFDGGNDFHKVDEVTNGLRDVLVIWFSKKQSKFYLI